MRDLAKYQALRDRILRCPTQNISEESNQLYDNNTAELLAWVDDLIKKEKEALSQKPKCSISNDRMIFTDEMFEKQRAIRCFFNNENSIPLAGGSKEVPVAGDLIVREGKIISAIEAIELADHEGIYIVQFTEHFDSSYLLGSSTLYCYDKSFKLN